MDGMVTAPVCRDAVIVIPGIMGSELVDAEAGDVLWGLSPRSYLRFWTSRGGLERLQVTDQEREGKTGRIRAKGLLRFPAVAPIFGAFEPYTRLVAAIRHSLAHSDALCEFAYDWRLPVAFNAARLGDAVEAHLRRWRMHRMGIKDASVVLVAHPMGGLVARCFTGTMGGASAVRQTVTLGTPFFGAVKAAYLLNAGRGAPVPLPRARLRELALTLPGLHDLLPSYRCVDDAGGRLLTPADVADLGGDSELAEASFAMQRTLAKQEPGRLVDRLGLPDDLAAHPARPSRRSASSCGTYEVCPAVSRARQSASAAWSSASSSSCALAACSRARKRRKSDTGTTTAAWPPRWITSYDPVSGPLAGTRSAGWAVIVLPPIRGFQALLSILACPRAREASCRCNRAGVLPDSAEIPSAATTSVITPLCRCADWRPYATARGHAGRPGDCNVL
jgi:hypothetical protein